MADDRLIEIMAELLAEVRDIKVDIRDVKGDVSELKTQQAKTNLAIGELRLSVMMLADRIEMLLKLDQRVKVLEDLMLPPSPRKAA